MNESKREGVQIEADQERDEEDAPGTDSNDAAPGGEARGRSRRRRPGRGAPRAAAQEPEVVPGDERSREALEFARDIIRKMGMDCDVRLQRREEEDGDINIQVTGPDAGRIIGKKGQVLAAV